MEILKFLYLNFKDNKKERLEMILEPFQTILQLSLLSFYPVGTKLSISNNIVKIHESSWTQSVVRNYQSDKKNDLIYLFNVIKRFHYFYDYLKTKNNTFKLYSKLVKLSKDGIEKLILTYSGNGNHHLIQTLNLYKILIDNPNTYSHFNVMNGNNIANENIVIENSNKNNVENNKREKNKKKDKNDKSKKDNTEISEDLNSNTSNTIVNDSSTNMDEHFNRDIDKVFKKITNLYDNAHFIIILNLLNLIEKDPQNVIYYTKAIDKTMIPIENRIKQWINDNIIL